MPARSSLVAPVVALLGLAASCASNPEATVPSAVRRPAPVAPRVVTQAVPLASPLFGRIPLVPAEEVALPIEILPIPGGESVLFVSQFAGDRSAWARRLDGRTGALGPAIGLPGQHVLGAFERPGDRYTIVGSDGADLCLATYGATSAEPEARVCAAVAPIAIVSVAERLALIETTATAPPLAKSKPAPGPAPARPPKPAKEKARAPSPVSKRTGASKRPSRKVSASSQHPPTPVSTEVRLRWATDTVIDAEPRLTGLHFDQPLGGMGLVDARARASGIDSFWYEAAPNRKTHAPLGSARLMGAALRADGTLDFASRVPVIEGDLEYGAIHDHRGVRFVGLGDASVYVGVDAKGQCEALRVLPSLARLAPSAALCAVDPDHLAAPPADLAPIERILAADPRRAFGQPKSDSGLVAWAGSRGYFLRGGRLVSAARLDGVLREEPAPLSGRRARLSWGSIAPDGEGLALTGKTLVHVDAQGHLVGASIAEGELDKGLVRAPEIAEDRRPVARIGASWWMARGDVVRLFPEPIAPPALRGAVPSDAAVLVGGPERGVLVEVAGTALRLTSIDAAGASSALGGPSSISPVRVGFDACERAAGGALVAGVSAVDPAKVVAFAIDRDGRLSTPVAVPLPIQPGDTAVRLTPLPGGGAVLSDRDRLHVVWLDSSARPVADAPYPLDESDALCLDGRPARTVVPAPTPGVFIAIPDFATPGTCISGEPVWTPDGELRWFGSAVHGLDASVEVGIAPIAGACAAIPPASSAPFEPDPACRPAPAPVCPSDMVSVAGRYCVDRFESTLMDASTGYPLSPDYPATPNLLDFALGEWATARERTGNVHARAFPLPFLAPARLGRKAEPVAINRLGVRPNGYVTGVVAETACAAAGKRLCSLDEFVVACRGEDDTAFPYGDTYEDGICNVFREEHPAVILHNNASVGHLNPRLNRVSSKGRPLLQRTGQSLGCRSRWGSDAAYDLAGNLDEWVAEGNGAFAGGFYSRSTRAGCDALVTAHPFSYLDYSTGVRCCRDALAVSP